MYHIG